MIDSHCHLTDPRLLGQLEAVLQRATAAGVSRIITIGTHPGDAHDAVALCQAHANVRCAVGVHPNYCHQAEPEDLRIIRALQSDPAVLAVGETGLDYHYHFADRARQRRFFQMQMSLASELNRPVVIHCREAVDDTLAVLRDHPSVPAVFHCFTGTADEADRIIERGYLLGFTGVVTFRNADGLRQAVRRAPRERIVVETDAPYLAPEPMRKQKINEPAFVVHTAETIARVLDVTLEEVDRFTTENVERFFGWK